MCVVGVVVSLVVALAVYFCVKVRHLMLVLFDSERMGSVECWASLSGLVHCEKR
jgi:hypothetical protein